TILFGIPRKRRTNPFFRLFHSHYRVRRPLLFKTVEEGTDNARPASNFIICRSSIYRTELKIPGVRRIRGNMPSTGFIHGTFFEPSPHLVEEDISISPFYNPL
ncbi:Hypothetical protein FKW44_000278, partial [Caligus rogercresseyi]